MPCTVQSADKPFTTLAAKRLREGKLVAFPTETVYGLGGNACDDETVARIYATKGRPDFNPLIVHLAHPKDVGHYATLTPLAQKLADAFWPGPCTLVLDRKPDSPLSLLVSAGLDSVAIRVPAHEHAHSLLDEAGIPIAAPSANRSGRLSPTQAEHVEEEFAQIKEDIWVLDSGPCGLGLESTVIDARGEVPVILRPGAVTAEEIALTTGVVPTIAAHDPESPHSPGQLKSHYAPERPVRLNAKTAREGEVLLTFGKGAPSGIGTLNLSPDGNLIHAAANLFAMLRLVDRAPYTGIAVMPIPEEGLGVAINDRLRRAAADRD